MFLFDFDGVLIDSAREAGLSAYNAVFDKQYTKLSQLPDGCMELFFKNIFHFHNPYTLCNLMKWCGDNSEKGVDKVMTRAEFSEHCAKQTQIVKAEITPYFYSIRVRFMESHPAEWLELNRPFKDFWQYLIGQGADDLIILTAKNRKAVYTLCHHYGLKIPNDNIYAGDNNLTKMDNFETIHKRFGKDQYHFIDDHLSNLKDIDKHCNKDSAHKVKLYLCDWGYGDKEDHKEARDLGYGVPSQAEFIEIINKERNK